MRDPGGALRGANDLLNVGDAGLPVAPTYDDWQARAGALALKRSGRELVGPCPSCGGTDRFSVADKDGRAVFNCRQCNGFRDILKAAGFADDRPDPAPRVNGARHRAPSDMTHVYRDPKGEPYHRVFRRGSGPDKEVWQDSGFRGRFYPYQIEHLPDIGERPIVIVEGEKCAEHLLSRGYLAMAWCGGADGVTRTRWDVIAGYPVIPWPDADASGKGEGAMRTLTGILHGLGCDARIVRIPEGKPDKWDCADATDDEIHRLIADAAPVSGSNELAPPIRGARGELGGGMFTMSIGDLYRADLPTPEYLVDEMINTSGLVILGAKPKVGKTTFNLSIALSVARGETFLDRTTKRGPVLLAAFEEDPSRIRARLQAMGVTAEDPIYLWFGLPPANALYQIEAAIERINPALVILDPMAHLAPAGTDEAKFFEMTEFLAPLHAMGRRHRACILIAHHCRKSEAADPFDEMLGSTANTANVDTTLHMSRDPATNQRVLRSRQRYGDDLPPTVLVLDPATERIGYGGTAAGAKARDLEADILGVIADHDGPMKKGDIEEAVTGKRERVRACLDALCRDGRLTSRKEGRSIVYEIA